MVKKKETNHKMKHKNRTGKTRRRVQYVVYIVFTVYIHTHIYACNTATNLNIGNVLELVLVNFYTMWMEWAGSQQRREGGRREERSSNTLYKLLALLATRPP